MKKTAAPVSPVINVATILCLAAAMTVVSASATMLTPTTTALTVPAPAIAINLPVALTARITPDTAVGIVTFFDGANVIGVGNVSQGVATFNYIPFFAGQRLLRAYYRGSGTNDPSYSPVITLTVQSTPSGTFGNVDGWDASDITVSPVIGDFNNDGLPDVAALIGDGTIVILLNTGLLAYTTSIPVMGLNAPLAMVTGDFNSDGNLDLAVADTQNSQIVILFGRGDGTFQPGISYSTGNTCSGIVAADFNGDGVIDVATENGTNGISLFINNGDGTFQAAINTPISGSLSGIVTGDFNRDGIGDIALANTSADTVNILLGGASGFSAPVSYTVGAPAAITVADFNGDHIMDLAVINNTAANTSLLLGNADGTFQIQTGVGVLPDFGYTIASGDLDGDGAMDFVVTGINLFCISMGKGDGTFYVPYCINSFGVDGIALGSADLFGTTDFVVTGQNAVVFVEGGPFPPVITGGNAQTLAAGSSAPIPLQVQLTDFGHNYETAGLGVIFAAPYPGPGGYFNGSGNSVTVSTIANGTATAPEYVANGALGTYSIMTGGPVDPVFFSLVNAAPAIDSTTCTYTISPAAIVFNSSGGSAVVTVTPAPSTCAWSVSTSASWVTPSATDLSGATTVTISAPANLSGLTQLADMLVAGQYMTVLQWATSPVVADAPAGSSGAQVTDMVGYGFSSGCGADPLDYCPTEAVTRAEAAILLVRAVYGSDNFTYSMTPHFNDVNASTYGFQWIQKLFELGITTGCGNGDYCPTENLPRDQAAVLVVRSRLGATTPFDGPSQPYFTDVSANAFGFASIQRLRLENITTGCAPTLYCPSDPITRAELAAFIMRGLTNQFLPVGMPIITEVTSPDVNVRLLSTDVSTTVVLTGQNTHFDNTSTVVVAGGVSTSDLTIFSPTYATVQVTGTELTQLDIPESIIVTTGSEEAVIPNAILFETDCD